MKKKTQHEKCVAITWIERDNWWRDESSTDDNPVTCEKNYRCIDRRCCVHHIPCLDWWSPSHKGILNASWTVALTVYLYNRAGAHLTNSYINTHTLNCILWAGNTFKTNKNQSQLLKETLRCVCNVYINMIIFFFLILFIRFMCFANWIRQRKQQ